MRFSTLLPFRFSPLASRPHADDRAFSEASANEATAFVIQQDNDRVQFSQQQILPREMPSDLPWAGGWTQTARSQTGGRAEWIIPNESFHLFFCFGEGREWVKGNSLVPSTSRKLFFRATLKSLSSEQHFSWLLHSLWAQNTGCSLQRSPLCRQPAWERGATAKHTSRARMVLEVSLKITLGQAIES